MKIISELLLDFIAPILLSKEDEHEILSKAKIGQIVWNFCVSDQNNLPHDQEMKSILKSQLINSPEINKIVNYLTIRKNTLFSSHNEFISYTNHS